MVRRIHTCIITAEALAHVWELTKKSGCVEIKLMDDDPPENLISINTVMPLTALPNGMHMIKIEEITKS